MSNPLMGMMGGNAPVQNSMAQMIGMLKNAGNPGAMLQNMAQSDPTIKKAMDMYEQQYGALLTDNLQAEKDGWTWINQPFPWDRGEN